MAEQSLLISSKSLSSKHCVGVSRTSWESGCSGRRITESPAKTEGIRKASLPPVSKDEIRRDEIDQDKVRVVLYMFFRDNTRVMRST